MKYLNILLALIFTAGFLTSCEDDMDPKVPGDAVNPILEAPASGGTYVLKKVEEEEQLTSLVFSEADFKLDVVTEYTVEVDDADGNFEFRRVVASGTSSPIDLKVGTFNKSLLGLGYEDGKAHDIQLRVVAGNYLASEPITMNVTTYFDAEPWSVIGSAVGGWDTANDQFMTYDKEKDVYTITLDMVPGDFKFRAPKKDADGDPWKYNLGLDGGSIIVDNGENVTLKDGGDNIKCSGGNYTITVDVTNSKFTIVQNSAGEFSNWTDVVLDAVGSSVSADNPNATADPSGWGWGNVLLPDNEGKPSVDGSKYTWTWTGIILETGEDAGFKLRTLNGEASPVNGMNFDVGFGAVDTENSSDKVADKGGNISVTEKGEYLITLVIDAASGDTKKVTITEYVKFPNTLYFVGTNNGWNEKAPHYIGISNADEGKYLGFLSLADDSEVKILTEVGSWDGYGAGANTGELAAGGGNIVMKDQPGFDGAGQYIVKMDINLMTIELVKITHVAVVGDGANPGWPDDAGNNAGAELTYDEANKKFTGTVGFNAGGEWKFRFNKSWDYNLGSNDKDLTKLTPGGGNFATPGAGDKTVSLMLESTEQYNATVE
jgi:hypothetical protein